MRKAAKPSDASSADLRTRVKAPTPNAVLDFGFSQATGSKAA